MKNVSSVLYFRVKKEGINGGSSVKPSFIPKHMRIYNDFTVV